MKTYNEIHNYANSLITLTQGKINTGEGNKTSNNYKELAESTPNENHKNNIMTLFEEYGVKKSNNNTIQIKIEKPRTKNIDIEFIKKLPKNTILLGGGNTGKNDWISTHISKYNNTILSFDNIEQSWKNHLFKKDFNGNYSYGEIFKYIISSTLYNDVPFFITSMEVGSFNFKYILGNTLKDILKTNQRVKKEELNIVLSELSISKEKEEISIEDFIKIGNLLKEKYSYKVTYFQVGEYNIPLWLPENLYFLFASNAGEEIIESLEIENYSWSIESDRFKVIPFYNFLLKEKDEIFKVVYDSEKSNNDNINIINNFNNNISKILKEYIDLENPFNCTYFIPNFYPFGNDIEKMKNYILREVKKDADLEESFEEIKEEIEKVEFKLED